MNCPTGKQRFPTLHVAEIVLTGLRAKAALHIGRRWTNRNEQRVYACCKCTGWHITSKPTREALAVPDSGAAQ